MAAWDKPHPQMVPGRFTPAAIDFRSLANLPDKFAAGQEWRQEHDMKNAFASGLPKGPNAEIDFNAALGILSEYDPKSALSIAAAQSKANEPPARTKNLNSTRSSGNTSRYKPTEARRNAKYFSTLPDNDPRKASSYKLTSVEKKAIFETEDNLANLDGTIQAFTAAQGLNDNTYEGYTGGLRGSIGSKLPDSIVPDFIADPRRLLLANLRER